MTFSSAKTWVVIIKFHDCFMNVLLDNDSHLLFLIFQTSSIAIMEIDMPVKDVKKEFMQSNVLCILPNY